MLLPVASWYCPTKKDRLDCTICPTGTLQPTAHYDVSIACDECLLGRYIADDREIDTEHDVECFWDWHTIFYWNNSSAGGSNFGLKPALARREWGDEVVQLAEMWLGSIRGDAVKESGKDVLNGHCGGGDFIDWLFCLVLFFWVQLLWRYNWLKWKKKRKSTGRIRGTVGCVNSCWIRNCLYDIC